MRIPIPSRAGSLPSERPRRSIRLTAQAALASALALLASAPASAQITFKNAFNGLTFDRPIWFGEMPGVPEKTYVVLEQHLGNIILVRKNGAAWAKTTFGHLDVNQANEQGLLGLAFHPDYKSNHKYYVSYDTPSNYNNVIAEREADETLLKDAGKNRVLISITDKYDNHNGGTIAFGPKDGYLYWGTGDGGNQYDPDGNGQNKNVLLAKMLRIDVNKKDAGKEYGIPADNPFAAGGGRGEVWAYGFRNPFKWTFDQLNGDQWVGDVGQDNQEEVDIAVKGGNFGWSVMEGTGGNNNGSMTLPVFSYTHGTGNAVIGGVVYRGNPDSKYYGAYFTSDNGTKASWILRKNPAGGKATQENLATPPTQLSSFGYDAEGRIYACGLYNGIIYQIDSPDLGPAPTAIRNDAAARFARRVFAAAPGATLRMEAFGKAATLEIHSPDGRLAASIARGGAVPAEMRPGVYFLKASGAEAGKLLIQ
jgi:glucose/arabinose dehydrogenase